MLSTITRESSKNNNTGLIHDEYQYIKLIKDIIDHGTMENGRNGNAKTIFGAAMHFSLENNKIPILTTKKVAWKTCLKELLWFISGKTDNAILKSQNVRIWNDNASREFLDSRGLTHNLEDDLGPVYGHQWRHFNAKYIDCKTNYANEGIDQLNYIIQSLKDPVERFSRRLIMSAWNPTQLNEMALPPCHIICQFCVTDTNKLSCSLYQRSGDIGLGVPFNIASYAFLTHIIAKHCGLEPFQFVYFLGNAHIYDDHIVPLTKQVERTPMEFPTINISTLRENINDYEINDFIISEYQYHNPIKMIMRK
jgi:thymidylate synthase